MIQDLSRKDKIRVKKYLVGRSDYLVDLFDILSRQTAYDPTEFKDYGTSIHTRFDRLCNEIFDAHAHFKGSRKISLLRLQSAFELSQFEKASDLLRQFAQECLASSDLDGIHTAHTWRSQLIRSGHSFEFPPEIPDRPSVLAALNHLSILEEIYTQLKGLVAVPPSDRKLMLAAQRSRLRGLGELNFALEKFWAGKVESFCFALEGDFFSSLQSQKRVNLLLIEANISPEDKAKEIQRMAFLYFWSGDYKKALSVTRTLNKIEGLSDSARARHINDAAFFFSFDAGDYATTLTEINVFRSLKEDYPTQKRVSISYYSAVTCLFCQRFDEAIRWANETFTLEAKYRKSYNWAIYLVQCLAHFGKGDFEFSEQYRVRAIRASNRKELQLPVAFLRAYPNQDKLAKFLDEIDSLVINPNEEMASNYFDFQAFTASILFEKSVEQLVAHKYEAKTKSSLG